MTGNFRHRTYVAVRTFIVLTAVTAVLFFGGCSVTSSLAKDEVLYTGAEIEFISPQPIEEEGALEEQMMQLAAPEPNSSLLGLFRWKLWLYNAGIFRHQLGEAPVLLSTVSPDRITLRMQMRLENMGYFRSSVRSTIIPSDRSAEILYTATVTRPYTLRSYTVRGTVPLLDTIRTLMEETLIIPGDRYDLDRLVQERERIGTALKGRGYFFFSPEDILFRADSNAGNGTIDLFLELSAAPSERAFTFFTMGSITIHSGYVMNRDSVSEADTSIVNGCVFIDMDHEYEPAVIVRSVLLEPGGAYTNTLHDATLSRLMNLGIYTFVNIRFTVSDSAGAPRLDAHIYLTPRPTKNIQFELQGVSKSNNLAGPVFTAVFRNRNAFGGAELLSLSTEAGFEMPVSGGQSGGSSFVAGAHGELDLPKILAPFLPDDRTGRFVPKTRIAAGVRVLQRLRYYQMVSLESSFGYVWKVSDAAEHRFNPFAVTYAQLTSTTPEFRALTAGNPLLQRSFDEQFIIGQTYTFFYSDLYDGARKNHITFNGTVDLSGNILHLVQSLSYGRPATPEDPYRLANTVYSQYAKTMVDLRYYINSRDARTTLASRLIVGVGLPYGNSASLPYVKQFFSGGSNSIRAFAARSLGPGSFARPANSAASGFIDQAGDLALESTLEFRFPLVSIFRGAVFADAGNIWLLRDDVARPGGTFSGGTAPDEIAVGAGAGLRIDLSFFLLRFDLAVPLKVPSFPIGERWRFSAMAPGDPAWRDENLLFTIAIGYSF
jgi:hypothetical protein